MGEEAKIFEYLEAYIKREDTAPSVRKFCRDQNMTPPTFYRLYGSMGKLLEKAGLPIDERTKARLLISKKATRIRVRKAERKHSRVQTTAPIVETVNVEPVHTPAFEELMQKGEDEDSIREHAKVFAEELKTLVIGEDPDHQVPLEAYNALIDSLIEVLPVILYCKYDVWAELPDLLSAQDVLRKVRKEQKKLCKEQIQLDGERLEIQQARELLKRDNDKAALIEHVEKLEWRLKVNDKRFDETYNAFKQFRTLFRELMPVIRKFPPCQKVFVQNMMENHNDVLNWLTSGGMRLSFESEGTPKPASRT